MLEKLLDEPYWDEMEKTLTPWINATINSKSFSVIEGVDIVSAAVLAMYAMDKGDLENESRAYNMASERQIRNMFQIIKQDISGFRKILLQEILHLTRRGVRKHTSYTDAEISKEVMKQMAPLQTEMNIQVILNAYKKVSCFAY